MCIGIWTLRHPEYALILCTNRDEFLNRPTETAHFHLFGNESTGRNDSGRILSGLDVQAGGSWFGINRSGRVALLTNITEPAKKYNTSRGYLVSSFLLSDSFHPLEDEIGKIIPEDAKFAGFNLLLLAPTLDKNDSIQYNSLFVTNHGGGGTLTSRPLSPIELACGAMSNGVDGAGAELWPKVQHAKKDFDDAVLYAQTQTHAQTSEREGAHPESTITTTESESELVSHLFQVLAWQGPTSIVNRSDLRNTVHVVPVSIVLDGPAGVQTPTQYGTRTSTVLLVKKNGEVLFIERDIWKLANGIPVKADGEVPGNERIFRFKLDIKPE